MIRKIIDMLSLFTSGSTLLCCAIPSLLASIASASVIIACGGSPFLVFFAMHKTLVFSAAGGMLGLNYILMKWKDRGVCPIDKKEACESAGKWSKRLFWFSVVVFAVGVIAAYGLPMVL